MGYRELLKKYLRFVESQAGEDFIDAVAYAVDGPFSERELGELRALTVERATDGDGQYARQRAYSYRFRLLCLAFDLTLEQASGLAAVHVTRVRHWRANPLSAYYVAMEQTEFDRFERALVEWLARRHPGADVNARRSAVRRSGEGKNAVS
jgi:hypothetical protein